MRFRLIACVVAVVGCGVPSPEALPDAQLVRCGGPNDTMDFDADRISDACDVCPEFGSGGIDTDDDGIDDSCDPRFALPDRRLAFVPFYDESSIAGWIWTGVWTAHGGLEQASSTTLDSILDPTPRDVRAVTTELTVSKRTAGARVAVCLAHASSMPDCCELDLTGQRVLARVGETATSALFPNFFAYYDPIKIQMTTGTELRCSVTQGASTALAHLRAPAAASELRLTTANTAVRFRYLELFGDGPPPPPPNTDPMMR